MFHELIEGWFESRYGVATEVQEQAWSRIAAGEHVLVSAPTGSGKTLAAFLWAIDQLVSENWSSGKIRVLYVSPLRALNNDIRRNLMSPLSELEQVFEQAQVSMPQIAVATRSGDTPQSERRMMIRRPPEILITTPESLNILLTSKSGVSLLDGLRTVILDEVHAIAGSKRGTHLITAVERLTRLSGEFQRVALSATVTPMGRIADWVGGSIPVFRSGQVSYSERAVVEIEVQTDKAYEIDVCLPAGPPATAEETELPDDLEQGEDADVFWDKLAADIIERISANQSTLIFANSRRSVEKIARFINQQAGEQLVYSHHGSLSRAIREEVEERLKSGSLAGIVATNSLELGIDIGAIDEVVLVQTPPSITSAVQRVGRAGHRVGLTSRARLYCSHPLDALEASVTIRGLLDGALEPLEPPGAPLDVLAQVILSMVSGESWDLEQLFGFIKAADPYRDLSRRQFDLVIEMLAGRYAGARINSLKPRVAIDRISNTVRGRPGTAMLLYSSGGTIPDHGLFSLRLADSMTRIGQLDEEFVWERTVGEVISLGVQAWKILRITHNDVIVSPASSAHVSAPFWRSEERDRPSWFADQMSDFLQRAETELESSDFHDELQAGFKLQQPVVESLLGLLASQRKATGSSLPHRDHLVVEHVVDPQAKELRAYTVIHTMWGGRLNRPWAVALKTAWQEQRGVSIDVFHDDLCLVLCLEKPCSMTELLQMVGPEDVESLLRKGLEGTGFFGARFRENAGRALLLPRSGFRKRTPLWLNRQRSKELLGAVAEYEDFPILLETWRSCFVDGMEPLELVKRLSQVALGEVEISEVKSSRASPFAANVVWKLTNQLMYEDDTPEFGQSRIGQELLREVVLSAKLRPRLPADLVETFQDKLHRTYFGYSPVDGLELVEWVKERQAIPADEWRSLLSAVERDHDLGLEQLLDAVGSRTAAIVSNGIRLICAIEDFGRLKSILQLDEQLEPVSAALDGSGLSEAARQAWKVSREMDARADAELADFLNEWLRFYGPVSLEFVGSTLGLTPERLEVSLQILLDEDRVIVDELLQDASGIEVCDLENLERLLRIMRARSRSSFSPLAVEDWPLFMAQHHQLGAVATGIENLQRSMERLFGLPAPVEAWESAILPARLNPYSSSWLDALMADSDLAWFGCGERRLAFGLDDERDLFAVQQPPEEHEEQQAELSSIFPQVRGRFSLSDLMAHSGIDSAKLSSELWRLAWSGWVASDTYNTVRQGQSSGFKALEIRNANSEESIRPGRRHFARWSATRAFAGTWYLLPEVYQPEDAIAREELNKERVRVLLERYGILFRQLLARELPGLRWGALFRTMRLMELSGEIVAGRFFEGIPGLQFAAPLVVRKLKEGLDQQRIFWLNASDPVSPCGLGLEGLPLPRRVATTHLVFHGSRLVLVSERSAKSLEFRVEPDHQKLEDYLLFLKVLLTNPARKRKSIEIETINEQPAADSPYRKILAEMFFASATGKTLYLSRQY